MTLAQRLAAALRKVRQESSLSQVQMAKRLGIGQSTLNRLENADQNTTLRMLDRLCRALRCKPSDLLEQKTLGQRADHNAQDASGQARTYRRGNLSDSAP